MVCRTRSFYSTTLEIAIELVIEIVIELGKKEQTRLFWCAQFHRAENSTKTKPYSGTTYADFNHDFKHSGTPL